MDKIFELTKENLEKQYSCTIEEKDNKYNVYNYFGRFLFSLDSLRDVDYEMYRYINRIPNSIE